MSALDLVISRLAAGQHGIVAARQLLAGGLSRRAIARRVADGRLHRVHTGVFSVGGPPRTAAAWRMAAVLAVGPGSLVSHRSAAAAWGIRDTARAAVDVVIAARSRRQRPGITVHVTSALASEDRELVDGVPTTSIARTFLDLAEVVDAAGLRRAYERAQRLELLDVRAIDRVMDRNNGRHGVAALRTLRTYDPVPGARTRSELERRFLDLIRAAGLPVPLVNTMVEGYEVDAFWPRARLVVELQSWAYHRDRGAFERDHSKAARLKATGHEFLALTHRQLTREQAWVVQVLQSLLGRAKPSGSL